MVNGLSRWASLTTVQLDAEDRHDRTKLTWAEQYTFLTSATADDVAHLRGGTRLLLTSLAVELGATPHAATDRW